MKEAILIESVNTRKINIDSNFLYPYVQTKKPIKVQDENNYIYSKEELATTIIIPIINLCKYNKGQKESNIYICFTKQIEESLRIPINNIIDHNSYLEKMNEMHKKDKKFKNLIINKYIKLVERLKILNWKDRFLFLINPPKYINKWKDNLIKE